MKTSKVKLYDNQHEVAGSARRKNHPKNKTIGYVSRRHCLHQLLIYSWLH